MLGLFFVVCAFSGASTASFKRSKPTVADSRGKTLEVTLENERGNHYFAKAEVGGQSFRLLLDTGYGYFRVDSSKCLNCASEARFTKSASYQLTRDVLFGQTPAEIGTDSVLIDGVSVENQTLAVMKKVSRKNYRGGDGILGLGFEHPDTGDVNLLENLQRSGRIDRAVFALYLNLDIFFAREPSVITLGGWELQRFALENAFTFVDADLSAGTWSLPLTRPEFNGKLLKSVSSSAILSTAQDRMIVPKSVYDSIFDEICKDGGCLDHEGEPSWSCRSSSRERLPDLKFNLGGMQVKMTGLQWTIIIAKKTCGFNFRMMKGENRWILGTHFLQDYYTLFDAEQSKIGFAPAYQGRSSLGLFLCYVLGGLSVAIFIVLGIIAVRSEKKKEEEKEEEKTV